MPIIEIDGVGRVEVGNEFLSLSPEQQNATVQAIASSARKPMDAPFTRLLLDHGADPNVRASLRKQLHPGYGPDTLHEYRDVTPLSWGEQFHNPIFVSREALRLIAARGGGR